jgi:hypothetical protein
MDILGEKDHQDLECALREPFNLFVRIRFPFMGLFVRDLSFCLRNDRPLGVCLGLTVRLDARLRCLIRHIDAKTRFQTTVPFAIPRRRAMSE